MPPLRLVSVVEFAADSGAALIHTAALNHTLVQRERMLFGVLPRDAWRPSHLVLLELRLFVEICFFSALSEWSSVERRHPGIYRQYRM